MTALWNMFENDRVLILPVMALRERGPQISHYVRSRVVELKNVKRLIGVEHKELSFFIQVSTIDSSHGVSIDQFGYNML